VPVPFVVMELLDGELLTDRAPLHWPLAVRTAAEIAGLLTVCHARGVVHGRVDAGAVMLTSAGAKLLGLPGAPAGVPSSPRDDVYGLGRLLLAALVGPCAGGTGTGPGLAALPDLPGEVAAVCLPAWPRCRRNGRRW
jgi:hypothetical protein